MSLFEFPSLSLSFVDDPLVDNFEVILTYPEALISAPMRIAQSLVGKIIVDVAHGRIASTETARARCSDLAHGAYTMFY